MTPYYQDAAVTLYRGDALAILRELPDAVAQTCVTSPPYWGLRDYGTVTWEGGEAECGHTKGSEQKRTWGPGSTGSSTLNGRPGNDSHEREGWKGGVCGNCGARRIDTQLGLEPTPEAYVADLVAVFREVWRVLRDDGTLWLNLGDSYAADRGGTCMPSETLAGGVNGQGEATAYSDPKRGRVRHGGRQAHRDAPSIGLKHKDLVGIPWRVAFALQQPYYTGSIKCVEDRIWLAAMLDAEGCLFIHKRKAGQHNGQGYYRTNDNFGPGVEISNTSLALVERIMALVGKGSICSQGPDENQRRKQRIYRWNLRTIECRDFVRELYPYLVAKQQQARILIGCPSSGERAEAAHAALIALHRTGQSDVDFPAPASMLEPGWYLRSDIIWAKCNPMPESVTDRPTKAHEYLFLLAKRERYYYDAEAIAERVTASTVERLSQSTLDKQAGSYRVPGKTNGPMKAVGKGGVNAFRGQGHFRDGDNGPANREGRNMKDIGTGATRNRRTVWEIATQPYPEAHFATFPVDLVKPCVLAGSKVGDTVLDPFAGSGTTCYVAKELGRRAIGIDLKAEYLDLAAKRLRQEVLPL